MGRVDTSIWLWHSLVIIDETPQLFGGDIRPFIGVINTFQFVFSCAISTPIEMHLFLIVAIC